MAIFERAQGSRRYYKETKDPFPSAAGGVPTGSIVHDIENGDRFIYNGDAREWLPFIGEEDTLSVLEEIRDRLNNVEPELRIIRAAVATIANDQSDGDFPTDYN